MIFKINSIILALWKQVVISVSFISWSTAFIGDNDDYESSTFSKFRGYRVDIARQLAANNPNFNGGFDPLTGYPIEQTITSQDTIITGGYGATSQEVMIPAFLAAYGGQILLTQS